MKIKPIKPIHQLEPEEIHHALNQTRQAVLDGNEFQVRYNLETLAQSIRDSLVCMYPDREDDLNEIADANEATWYLEILEESRIIPNPLYEGVQALQKVYSYGISPDENMFMEMVNSINGYVSRACQPLVESGRNREKQLHSRKDKKNQYILKHCLALMREKPSPSAKHLWNRFPNIQPASVIINGAEIFKGWDSDDVKIFCILPDGKQFKLGFRAFCDYFKAVKEILHDNS